MKKLFFFLSCFYLIAQYATFAEKFFAIKSGAWEDVTVWSNESETGSGVNSLPSERDTVIILHSREINVNSNKQFAQNGMLIVAENGALTFSNGAKAIITLKDNAYAMLYDDGKLQNASQENGWINGNLLKYIEDGSMNQIINYEIGDDTYYSPFKISFYQGQSANEGFLAAQVFKGAHPKINSCSSIEHNRVIGPKWWRLTKPANSEFSRGNRIIDVELGFNELDAKYVDSWHCVDMAFCKDLSDNSVWQALFARNISANNNNGSCSDTRQNPPLSPNFIYTSQNMIEKKYANVTVNQLFDSEEFGSYILPNNDVLLADFIAGNQSGVLMVEELNKSCMPIYPNPASQIITIETKNYEQIKVINCVGVVIDRFIPQELKFDLNISNYPKGAYFIHTNNRAYKFVVE